VTARPRVAAHRGGAALWPENSLLAFRQALALGCELLECDVHLTADDRLAVIHDATLERTTTGRGAVRAHTARALAGVRVRGADGAPVDEGVPLLEDLLALAAPSGAHLLVEVKGPAAPVAYERREAGVEPVAGPRYPGLEERVLEALERAGLRERATIMAFNPGVLAHARALAPGLRRALLVAQAQVERAGVSPETTVDWARALEATDLGLQHTLLDERVACAARQAGLLLGVWTVNDEDAMRRVADLGVDILTTDRPDLAYRVLGR